MIDMAETKTLAWHGDPALKAEVMERLRQHRAEDSIVQRFYQKVDPEMASGYRGCAIGCTLPKRKQFDRYGLGEPPDDGWHAEVQRVYGISEVVAYAIDDCFEDQPVDRAGDVAVAVVEAIPVGADLSAFDYDAYINMTLDNNDRDAPDATAAWLIAWLSNAPVAAVTP